MSLDERRQILRSKVKTSKQRLAENGFVAETKETASDASKSAKDIIEKYPFVIIAGAAALGLMVGSSGKKSAVKAAQKPVKKPNAAVKFLKEAAIAYGLKMLDEARKEGEAMRSSVKDHT